MKAYRVFLAPEHGPAEIQWKVEPESLEEVVQYLSDRIAKIGRQPALPVYWRPIQL